MDFLVSERQQIGTWWVNRPNDVAETKEILGGSLTLDPHPVWNIPTTIDWDADPFGQRNWRFQFHCLKWLEPVRRTALAGGEHAEQSRNFWLSTVRSWCHAHLHGNDEYAWMDMADGLRTVELVLGAPLLDSSEHHWFENVLQVHLERLADLSRRDTGNHALHQLQGMFVAAAFLEEDNQLSVAEQQLRDLFENEYDADGTNQEGSLAYHDLNFHWWNTALQRVMAEGRNLGKLSELLEASRVNLSHFVRPDGNLEMIGDTPPGRTLSNDGTESSLYARSLGKTGQPPKSKSVTLKAGYAAGRSTWGNSPDEFKAATFYTLRWGTEAVHGHLDGSSTTIYGQSTPWIVDPGMYAYQRHPFRRYFKGRSSHNLVVAESIDTSGKGTELRRATTTDKLDSYTLDCKEYDGFNLTRHFTYLRDFETFIFFDIVERTDDSKQFDNFFQNWHFHPDTEVHIGLRTVSLTNQKSNATMRWLKRPHFELHSGETEPYLGWYSPSYGSAIPTNSLSVRPTTRGDMSWITTISVGKTDVVPINSVNDYDGFGLLFQANGFQYYLTGGNDHEVQLLSAH